jgi:hypothetical protein
MSREIRLNEMTSVLRPLEYPLNPTAVAAACDDVTLVLADGEANMGEVLRHSDRDSFASAEDAEAELMSLLPRNAVGEPFQSEGDA